MRKLNKLFSKAFLFAFVAMGLVVAGCSKSHDSEPDYPNNPDQPTVNPDKPVADPENTVTVNLLVGQDVDNTTNLGNDILVYVDAAHNLCGRNGNGYNVEIVDMGPVAGLGNIVTIPTDGWKTKTAIIVGHGYVLRERDWTNNNYISNYARLYVADTMISTLDAIMGYTVKYECPMSVGQDNEILLASYRVDFKATSDLQQTINIENGKNIEVESKPDWCDVKILTTGTPGVVITVEKNESARSRDGYINLINETGKARIRVYQEDNQIRLESSRVDFEAEGDLTKTVNITNGSDIEIVEKPEWCEVRIQMGTEPKITVTVEENSGVGYWGSRGGRITLQNTCSTYYIEIHQDGRNG